MVRLQSLIWCIYLCAAAAADDGGPYLANGFKIGDVTDHSAIVWTRLTAVTKPNPAELGKLPERQADDADIGKLPGAVPGMAGEVLLDVSTYPGLAGGMVFPIADVTAATDYTQHWKLDSLKPATKYYHRITARSTAGKI